MTCSDCHSSRTKMVALDKLLRVVQSLLSGILNQDYDSVLEPVSHSLSNIVLDLASVDYKDRQCGTGLELDTRSDRNQGKEDNAGSSLMCPYQCPESFTKRSSLQRHFSTHVPCQELCIGTECDHLSTTVREYSIHFKKCKKRPKSSEAASSLVKLRKISNAKLEEMESTRHIIDLDTSSETADIIGPAIRRADTNSISACKSSRSLALPHTVTDILETSLDTESSLIDDNQGKRKATDTAALPQKRRTGPNNDSAVRMADMEYLQDETSCHQPLPWAIGDELAHSYSEQLGPMTTNEYYQNPTDGPIKGSIFYTRTLDYADYNGGQFEAIPMSDPSNRCNFGSGFLS